MTEADTKILIDLREDGEDPESLWATPMGGNRYRLENTPFGGYRLSWQDIIEAEPDEDEILVFTRVVEKSGNRTVRVITEGYETTSEEAKPFLEDLENLGCSYEGFAPLLLCVNVSPQVDLQLVAEYLIDSGHNWEYADPKYEDLFPDG